MSDSVYIGSPGASSITPGSESQRFRGSAGRTDDFISLLSRVIQRDIVPNLITANRVIGGDVLQPGFEARSAWHNSGFNAERGDRDVKFVANHVRMADVARFVRLLRSTGGDAASALVDVLLSRGIGRSELCLDLLGPAARMIGVMWDDDECSFAEVNMVVARLHSILHTLVGDQATLNRPRYAPSILLSVAPGEQHSFGIAVVDAIFQDAGWSTTLSHTNDADHLIGQISARPFDAVGLSLSNEGFTQVLRATIMRLRAGSVNRDVVVLVGGPAFTGQPQLASAVGADAMIEGGLETAIEARNLLPRQRARSV